MMVRNFTAVIQQPDPWWVGWIEEIPGVNSQGATRDELLDNLHSALEEALEMNRADSEIDDVLARKICRDLGIAEL
jgi:predicted RNase H-like HicB family nuclease